jgi:sortase A
MIARKISWLLIAAGAVLCGAAALHFERGIEAQKEGQRTVAGWRTRQRQPSGHTRSSTVESLERSSLGQPIARLRIPRARIDAVVFEGNDAEILEKGPGHVPGTERPGAQTGRNNCVIAAHRDSHFRNLGWLHKGDRIEMETPDCDETFRVVSREIVDPQSVSVLAPSAEPRLTLITCYPFDFIGPAPRRLVIVALPVASDTQRSAHERTALPSGTDPAPGARQRDLSKLEMVRGIALSGPTAAPLARGRRGQEDFAVASSRSGAQTLFRPDCLAL